MYQQPQHPQHPQHCQHPQQRIVRQTLPQHPPMIHGRGETDPNHYDAMFNAKTRQDDRTNKTVGSQNVFEYNMFSPKFQNHDLSWQEQQSAPQQLQPTKRDQMNIFPTRTPERRPQQQHQQQSSHPMQNRQIVNERYLSSNEKIESFNRAVDSMHVPEDIQRPIASRDYARSNLDSKKNDQPQMAILDRQFSIENLNTGLPLQGGGSFEDMFY